MKATRCLSDTLLSILSNGSFCREWLSGIGDHQRVGHSSCDYGIVSECIIIIIIVDSMIVAVLVATIFSCEN